MGRGNDLSRKQLWLKSLRACGNFVFTLRAPLNLNFPPKRLHCVPHQEHREKRSLATFD